MKNQTNSLELILELSEKKETVAKKDNKQAYLLDQKYLENSNTSYQPKNFKSWWGTTIDYTEKTGLGGYYSPQADVPVVVYNQNNPALMYFAAAHEEDHKWRQNTGQPQNEAGPDRFARNTTGVGIYRNVGD